MSELAPSTNNTNETFPKTKKTPSISPQIQKAIELIKETTV
jgi:hypothetical protein